MKLDNFQFFRIITSDDPWLAPLQKNCWFLLHKPIPSFFHWKHVKQLHYVKRLLHQHSNRFAELLNHKKGKWRVLRQAAPNLQTLKPNLNTEKIELALRPEIPSVYFCLLCLLWWVKSPISSSELSHKKWRGVSITVNKFAMCSKSIFPTEAKV